MAGAVNIMRGLCGADWNPSEVMLAHRRPADVEPYRQMFRAPIRFDAEQNALIFPKSWLSHRLVEREPAIRRLLKEKIDALEAQFRDQFPEQVRRVLRIALLTDRTSIEDIAALFSMQPRTLNRRLSAFGLSFQDLVDEGRLRNRAPGAPRHRHERGPRRGVARLCRREFVRACLPAMERDDSQPMAKRPTNDRATRESRSDDRARYECGA